MTTKRAEQRKRETFLVYIVESPSSVDLYHKRYEGELLMKALELAGIPSEHKLAVDSGAFNASFTVGLQVYLSRPEALPPLLHISAHGSEKGVQLTSGEVIHWQELRDIVMPINKALDGNLILCMSSCQGLNACRMAMEEGELPFLGVIGNFGEPSWSDTAVAYITFYHLLAKGHYVQEAVEAMRAASGDPGFQEIQGKVARDKYIEKVKKVRMKAIAERLRKESPRPPDNPLAKALRVKK